MMRTQKKNGRTGKIALGTAAAMAATAAGYLAVKKLGANGQTVWEVRTHDDGWQLCMKGADRPTRVFETKKEAVQAAREHVSSHAPSELRIFTSDDRLLDSHTYEAQEA